MGPSLLTSIKMYGSNRDLMNLLSRLIVARVGGEEHGGLPQLRRGAGAWGDSRTDRSAIKE